MSYKDKAAVDAYVHQTRSMLEQLIREKVTDAIVEVEVDKFRESLQAKIKPLIESITIEQFEVMRNADVFREEIHLKLSVDTFE